MRRLFPASSRIFIGLILAYFLLEPRSISAQSLGDIAREQRAKVEHSSSAPHVYTNEDLSADTILVPADQERFSSTSAESPEYPIALPVAVSVAMDPSALSAATNAAVLPPVAVPQWPKGTPLGDVARYYRQQKQSREATARAVQKRKEIPAASRRPNFVVTPPAQAVQKTKRFIASTMPAPKESLQDSKIISSVTVNAGDSLWKIASRYLGDGNDWRQIAAANPQLTDPNRIHEGEQIALPAPISAVDSNHQVRVRSGDSLWKLAEAEWGSGLAWSCIAESNPQIEASGRIFPGQILNLPAKCSASS